MNHKPLSTILALAIFAVFVVSVQAQSGRRQTKPIPSAPVPTPTPEPTATPKEQNKEPELIFLVATDRDSAPGAIPLHFHSAAQQGCADRLRAKSSADVDTSQRNLGRGQAIEKAKKSVNTYVVLLTLRFDVMARSYDDIQLDFVVFAPQTAKVVITGRSWVNNTRTGPVVVGPTSRVPSGVYREQWLRQAGEEAADRILKKLNMTVPSPR